MKSYSQVDLLNNGRYSKTASFVEKGAYFLFGINSNPILELELPERVYDRLNIFAQDMAELTGAVRFKVEDLFQMLLADLTNYMKEKQDPKHFKERLSGILGQDLVISSSGKSEHVFTSKFDYDDEEYVLIDCKFKRSDILRLEVELADLNLLYPNHDIVVEDVLEAIIINFHEHLISGENKEAVTEIRKYLSSGKDVWRNIKRGKST